MPRPRAPLALAAAGLLSFASLAGPALAQVPAAEALFQKGREHFKEKRYAEACLELAESQRLEPKLGTLLNLALCHETVGKTASAWAEYTSAATLAGRDGQKDREAFARQKVDELDKKLTRLVLVAGENDAASLRVTLDGTPLDRATFGLRFPIDPGPHQISASADGKQPWTRAVEIPPAAPDFTVTIPRLDAAVIIVPIGPPPGPEPVAPAVPPLVRQPAPAPPPPAPAGPSAAKVLTIAGFTVSGLGFVAGAITGALTLKKSSELDCPSKVCPANQAGTLHDATTLANVSNVGLIIGGAGLAAGITGLLLQPAGPSAAKASLQPFVGPMSAGLRGSF